MAEAGTGGPPLISELNRIQRSFHPSWAEDQGPGGHPLFQSGSRYKGLSTPPGRRTRDRGATPYFRTDSAYQGLSTLHGRRTGTGGPPLISIQPFTYRTGGPPLISFQNSTRQCLRPARANGQGRGAPPCFTALPGKPDAEAAGRCHYPGAVSTVAAGAGPYLRPGAVSPLFHRLFLPVPSDRTRSPPHDAPVQDTRSSGPG